MGGSSLGGSTLGGGKSDSSNRSGFQQDVWSPQGDALQNMYGQASNLFGGGKGGNNQNPQDQMNSGQQFSQGAMDSVTPAWQSQMSGGAYGDLGIGNELMSSLRQSENNPSAMQDINGMIMGGSGNNYADAMKNQYVQDATKAQNNMMSNMDSRAAASQMSGGDRHGMAIGQGMDGINKNLQSNMAQTGFNTFDKDLDRKLGIAQQADQNTMSRQNLMSGMLGQQQNTMNQGVQGAGDMMNYGSQQQMMPWQQMGAYSNTIGGPQVLSSGSSSGNSSSKAAGGSVGKK